jgi:hypothetical protein
MRPVVDSKKRELALLNQMPWTRGADGVEGPGSAPPQHLPHSLRAARRLERKERELPRAFAWASVHAALSVGKVVCAFCELPCQRVGVLRGGAWERHGSLREPSGAGLVIYSPERFRRTVLKVLACSIRSRPATPIMAAGRTFVQRQSSPNDSMIRPWLRFGGGRSLISSMAPQ